MIIPLVAGALFCATPALDNKTDTWTQQDQSALLEVQKGGCKQYNPKEPCLYVFTKNKDNTYTATCGPEQRRKDD
jgi:hypothetical protein